MSAARSVGSKGGFDPHKMYDVSEAELLAIQERAKIRATLKEEYQKKVTNPFRGPRGYVFDPAIQRFLSMRANHWEQFKPAPKNFAFFFLSTLVPIGLLWWKLDEHKNELERKCRNGEIAYKDREWKYVN